jgi:hypothetical protein
MSDNARLHDHEKLIAADEIDNIKHLRFKMQYGQENTAIDVSPVNPLPVTLGSENITITGDVNVGTSVSVTSTPENPVHVHLTEVGTSGLLSVSYLPIGGSVSVISLPPVTGSVSVVSLPPVNGSVSVVSLPPVTGSVSVISLPPVTGSVSVVSLPPVTGSVSVVSLPPVTGSVSVVSLPPVTGSVSVVSLPPVTGSVSVISLPPITGSVSVISLPEVEIKNDLNNPIPISGNVAATIADVITVIVDEAAGDAFAFNNHAAAVHRGWVMDDTMRPVISIQVRSGFTEADLVKIVEYEIGNNNANQSTIMYEWYEGPLTISGAAIPSWTNVGTKVQYRVYQDQYSSNQGNTFTVPANTYMRHSGIIIGKNSTNDEAPVILKGGTSPNMLTLCMKRLDNGTELDVWFAFTFKELAKIV